ncbi:MAG: CHRD domain-containing protein, partial [Chloroflexi bacterium]|nr:CHRD domain-containing protein [Chloroflexota bacterium]
VTIVPTETQPITVTMAHIHFGAAGVPGPVVRPLDMELTGPTLVTDTLTLSGIETPSLTTTEVNQLLSDQIYVNVHTTAHPGGEIRGQVVMAAEPNQPYVDEVDNQAHDGSHNPNTPADYSGVPFLTYAGPFNQVQGTVGLVHRDQPSLEQPGITYRGRTAYTTFGLEGVSDCFDATFGITPTTRSELLGTLLNWGLSEPGAVAITDTTTLTSTGFTSFEAGLVVSSTLRSLAASAQPVSYRWDFGDGSAYTAPLQNSVTSHTYTTCGAFTVRAEIADENGNVAIGSKVVNVTRNCGPQAGPASLLYLPIIGR